MGMAAPDVVLFVVGFLLFGGAVTALVVSGGPAALGGTGGAATGIYTLEYATAPKDLKTQAVADFSIQQKVPLDVTLLNVSAIHVTIQCTDPAGAVPNAQFNIQIQVQPPAGITAPAPKFGICGQTIALDIPITAVPPKTSVAGSSPEDARAQGPHDANESRAVGSWTITTNGARAGSASPVPIPVGNPGGSIVVKADQWDAKATVVPK